MNNQRASEILENFQEEDQLNIEEKRILFLWYFYNKDYHKCINLIYDLNKTLYPQLGNNKNREA